MTVDDDTGAARPRHMTRRPSLEPRAFAPAHTPRATRLAMAQPTGGVPVRRRQPAAKTSRLEEREGTTGAGREASDRPIRERRMDPGQSRSDALSRDRVPGCARANARGHRRRPCRRRLPLLLNLGESTWRRSSTTRAIRTAPPHVTRRRQTPARAIRRPLSGRGRPPPAPPSAAPSRCRRRRRRTGETSRAPRANLAGWSSHLLRT